MDGGNGGLVGIPSESEGRGRKKYRASPVPCVLRICSQQTLDRYFSTPAHKSLRILELKDLKSPRIHFHF